MRVNLHFTEHDRADSTELGFTIHRLLHLGSMKGCPLCKDIQKRNLSQVREYRFSIKNRELFRVLATCFAYEDSEQPLWDVSGTGTRFFNQSFPIEDNRRQIANVFMQLVRAEFEGIPETMQTGSQEELERYEQEYLGKQKDKSKQVK